MIFGVVVSLRAMADVSGHGTDCAVDTPKEQLSGEKNIFIQQYVFMW